MKTLEIMTLRPLMFSSMLLLSTLLTGCGGDTYTAAGAKTGAAVGAGLGLFLGILADDPALGLAAGAAVGASHGAYDGWRADMQDSRSQARTQQVTEAIRERNSNSKQSNLSKDERAREQLTRFLGEWNMKGWAQETNGQRIDISAKVNGKIEMTYFVELAYIDLAATGVDQPVWGTSMLGYDSDGYTINTTLNVLPESLRSQNGVYDQGSRSFTFSGSDYQLVISFNTPDRFTIETMVSGKTVESYQFTRTD